MVSACSRGGGGRGGRGGRRGGRRRRAGDTNLYAVNIQCYMQSTYIYIYLNICFAILNCNIKLYANSKVGEAGDGDVRALLEAAVAEGDCPEVMRLLELSTTYRWS